MGIYKAACRCQGMFRQSEPGGTLSWNLLQDNVVHKYFKSYAKLASVIVMTFCALRYLMRDSSSYSLYWLGVRSALIKLLQSGHTTWFCVGLFASTLTFNPDSLNTNH